MHGKMAVSAVALALLGGAAAAQQQGSQQGSPPQQQRVRGDIVSVDGDTLEVKTRIGQDVKLKLKPDARVATVDKADLDSIAQGSFVGTTALPQPDGTLRAVEVHIFPESMRGTGEGHRPWDLQPKSTMTNATVSKVQSQPGKSKSTMTNATVSKVDQASGGRKLDLKYKDGEKTVVVPPGTPVVKMEPGDRSLLKPGAHVFVIVSQGEGGALTAERVTVGKNGVVPPM
jgi:hypothetical protein